MWDLDLVVLICWIGSTVGYISKVFFLSRLIQSNEKWKGIIHTGKTSQKIQKGQWDIVRVNILITNIASARRSWGGFCCEFSFTSLSCTARLDARHLCPGIECFSCGDFWEVSLSTWGKKAHPEAWCQQTRKIASKNTPGLWLPHAWCAPHFHREGKHITLLLGLLTPLDTYGEKSNQEHLCISILQVLFLKIISFNPLLAFFLFQPKKTKKS